MYVDFFLFEQDPEASTKLETVKLTIEQPFEVGQTLFLRDIRQNPRVRKTYVIRKVNHVVDLHIAMSQNVASLQVYLQVADEQGG